MDGGNGRSRSQGRRLFGTTKGKVLVLLCRGPRTVGELAGHLRVTANAVRAQLQRLQRDGLVRPAGSRRGVRRPHVDYELTAKALRMFPRAYEPVLRKLVDALSARVTRKVLRNLLAGVVRGLLREEVGEVRATDPRQRLSEIVAKLGGLPAGVELQREAGATLVRSCSCPLATVTASHPELCAVFAGVVGDVLGAVVREKCDRGDAPRCCFQVAHG